MLSRHYLADLKIADAMRPFRRPLPVTPPTPARTRPTGTERGATTAADGAAVLSGPVTYQADRQAQAAASWDDADPESLPQHPPTPLPGYQFSEITITAGSPAAGRTLGDLIWPPGSTPVIILRGHQLRPPEPELTLAPATASACSPRCPATHPDAIPAAAATPRQPSTGAATMRDT